MHIRPAHPDDLEQINRIYHQAVAAKMTADTGPVPLQQRRAWLAEHDPAAYPVWVYEADGLVAGWVSLSAYRPGREALRQTAELSYYIDEAFHGRGIGTALVRFAVQAAPALGLRVLFAIILEHNAASIALIRKCGFAQWGFLPEVARFGDVLTGHVYYGLRL